MSAAATIFSFLVACVPCHQNIAQSADHQKVTAAHKTPVSCVSCHRGSEQAATSSIAAHDAAGPNEVLRGRAIGAACVQCHVAGSLPETESVVRGGQVYLELGCRQCHLASGFGALDAFAPPLDTIGFRGRDALKKLLIERPPGPTVIMPSFAGVFHHRADDGEALLDYLASLRGKAPPAVAAGAACVSCHKNSGKLSGADHECRWIVSSAKGLRCTNCHKGVIEGSAECLYIGTLRKDCGACHSGALDGN